MTRDKMEATKITENINLTTLAKTNQGAIPLPVTLVPSKSHQPVPHPWDGCPSLRIGNNSGWYMFTLCEHGLARYLDNEPMSIWGDYCCLNFKEIIEEAVKVLGWDFSNEVILPPKEMTYTVEIKKDPCPHDRKLKYHIIFTDQDGNVHDERWRKTERECEEHFQMVTGGGKRTISYWQKDQKVILNYDRKAA